MPAPFHTSPFLHAATLELPSVPVHFNFSDGAKECLVKHIHVEALKHFHYFQGQESFRQLQGQGQGGASAASAASAASLEPLDVAVLPNVRPQDLAAFLLFLYEGSLPSDWRQVYSVWCLCDFLLAPKDWRKKLLKRLWQAVKGKDMPDLRKLAEGSPEMADFCARAQRFMGVDRGELQSILQSVVALHDWRTEDGGPHALVTRCEKLLQECDSAEALAALVATLKNPAIYTAESSRPASRRWQLQRGRVYASPPPPEHGLELTERVYDVLGRFFHKENFQWLWRCLLPFLDVASPDAVERFHSVSNFFTDFKKLKVRNRCTRLEERQDPESRGMEYCCKISDCEVPLMDVLVYQPLEDAGETLQSALHDMLLIACNFLGSELINVKDFIALLNLAGPRQPGKRNPFALETEQFCQVLQQVPGSHCAVVRKHVLMKGFLSCRWRDDELLATIFDMF